MPSTSPDPAEVAAALQVSIGTFMRRLRQVPIRDDLTTPDLTALSRLDREGPATPSQLARAEQISPQAMGVTVSGLERRGLVNRSPDPGDGRRTVLSLTEAGRQLLHNKRSARTRQLAAALAAGFTAEELRVLRQAAPLIERLAEGI
ncbi:MAG TPA: MarR family transcriptional regulator [Trebonia sp.]|jgi:DNA-binding MarR family transcriptional regulator|nr:MarR family transcriptional regulator [Trebonia sp.]